MNLRWGENLLGVLVKWFKRDCDKKKFACFIESNIPKGIIGSMAPMTASIDWIMSRSICSYGEYYPYVLYDFETSGREGSPNPVRLGKEQCKWLRIPYGTFNPSHTMKRWKGVLWTRQIS